MSLKIFLKKPPEVQGLQWTLDNFKEFAELGGLIHLSSKHKDCLEFMDTDGDWHQVKPGEWIVRDEDSALWSHTHDTMTKRYDQIKLTTIEGAHPFFIKTVDGYHMAEGQKFKAGDSIYVQGYIGVYKDGTQGMILDYTPARGNFTAAYQVQLDGDDDYVNIGEQYLRLLPRFVADMKTSAGEVQVSGIDIYGYCPYCAARGKSRERRLDGNDTCENGHTYKSSEALREPK